MSDREILTALLVAAIAKAKSEASVEYAIENVLSKWEPIKQALGLDQDPPVDV